jgi:Protein of unknown function (DUF3738)
MPRRSIASTATEPAAHQLRFFGKLLLAAASLAVTSLAQTSTPPSPSSQPPGSTSATALPAFEVAAIKLNQSGSGSSHSDTNDGRFNATLPELAEALTQELSRELGRDIIDKTEIKGRYDLTLKWTQDAGATTDSAASSADSGPSIFTAVLEQLGLKLEPAKAPVQVLVIDHAEMPSEN